MDKYRLIKNTPNLILFEVYDEAEVDSLCSADQKNWDGICGDRDCIDCLVIHGVVSLESEV